MLVTIMFPTMFSVLSQDNFPHLGHISCVFCYFLNLYLSNYLVDHEKLLFQVISMAAS